MNINRENDHFNNCINKELHSSCKLEGHTNSVEAVKFLNNNTNQLISGSHDTTVLLWDFEKNKVLNKVTPHSKGIWELTVDENKKIIVSTSSDGSISFTDLNTFKVINKIDNAFIKGYSVSLADKLNN